MIYLNPPFRMIEGVTVLPDHDPAHFEQFYYLPSGPRLSTQNGLAVFHALQYTGNDTSSLQGGFLSFQVDLGIDDKTEGILRKELAGSLNAAGRKTPADGSSIRLAPLPVAGGAVQLMLYDHAGDKGDKSAFVGPTRHSQTPSLYGDNRAIFSVNLTRPGMELVHQSISLGKNPPIGVIYALTYVGLLPAYNVKVTAHWEQVYDHFATRSKKNYVFYQEDISKDVITLKDKKCFEIDVTKMTVEGEDKSADERLSLIVNRLTDMVINKFFTPVLSPEPDKGGKGAGGIFDSISGMFSKIGSVGYSFSEESVSRSYFADLTAEVKERIAVRRVIAPSAFLSVLRKGQKFADPAIESVVFGKHKFFQFRTLTVRSSIDFVSNDIKSIQVDASYSDFQPKTVLLTAKDSEPADLSWARDAKTDDVDIAYTVRFNDAKPVAGRPPSAKRKFSTPDQVLYIAPQQELFRLSTISVEAEYGFPWDRYPRVTVELRPAAARGGAPKTAFSLSKDKPADTYRNWSDKVNDELVYQYRVRYTGDPLKGGDGMETAWRESRGDLLLIGDPRPLVRNLKIDGSNVNWNGIKRISVVLRYEKVPELSVASKIIDLDSRTNSAAFSYYYADTAKKLISYTMKVKYANREVPIEGSVWEDELSLTAPGTKDEEEVQLLAGCGAVRLTLEGVWDSRFDAIHVTVQHHDENEELDDSRDKFTFVKTSADQQEWQYYYLSPSTYQYKIEYRKGSNVVRIHPARGLDTAGEFDLKIPASPK